MTRIIIDSTIDLPEQYRRQVHIVPLTIHFGTEELLDGVDIDRQRFYERLVESDVLPTTSQPSPDAFAQLFDQVEAAGDSAVLQAPVTAKLAAGNGGELFVVKLAPTR